MFQFHSAVIAALALLGAGAAHAETPLERLIDLGRFAGQSGLCEVVGFETHDAGEQYARLAAAEGVKGGLSEETSMTYLTGAMSSAAEQSEQAVSALAKTSQTDGAGFAAMVRNEMSAWTATCRKIAQDPIGRALVSASSSSDETLARDAADKVLWKRGWASWQTPAIRAGGDLAYAVSACSAHLTRPQAATYIAPLHVPNAFPPAGDRAERYFDFWLDQGQADAEELGFDAAQCKRILTERAATLKTTPR